jgi:hypothetical protein
MHWSKQADEEFVRGASGMKRTNGCSRDQSVTVTGESSCWRTSFFAAFLIRLGTSPVCTRIWSQPPLHTLWPRWLSEHLDNSLDVCYYGLPRPDDRTVSPMYMGTERVFKPDSFSPGFSLEPSPQPPSLPSSQCSPLTSALPSPPSSPLQSPLLLPPA